MRTSDSHRYRTIWISDMHLGTRGCKAEFLLDFLRHNDARRSISSATSSMAGGCASRGIGRKPTTTSSRSCLRKVRKGTRVIYVPGNHDEWLRDYKLLSSAASRSAKEAVHVTADGRRLLVIHGDVYDVVVKHARWLAILATAHIRSHCGSTIISTRCGTAWDISIGRSRPILKHARQERSAIHRLVCRRSGERGPSPRCRRCRLRPYPSRRDPRHRTACFIAMTAIGSRAAPRSSSISMAASRSSDGPKAVRPRPSL